MEKELLTRNFQENWEKNVEESEQLKNMLIRFISVCVHDKSSCNHMEINYIMIISHCFDYWTKSIVPNRPNQTYNIENKIYQAKGLKYSESNKVKSNPSLSELGPAQPQFV